MLMWKAYKSIWHVLLLFKYEKVFLDLGSRKYFILRGRLADNMVYILRAMLNEVRGNDG